jgi:hypothetical protein
MMAPIATLPLSTNFFGMLRLACCGKGDGGVKFFPPFKDEGEVVAAWGQAQLIKYLDGETELKGGSKEDRIEAREWISLFWHEAVVSAETA